MFTRTELEIKTFQELQTLCTDYGLRPIGNPAHRSAYVSSLLVFPTLAVQQMRDGRGLKAPSFYHFQAVGAALADMNSPTREQIALIKASIAGKRLAYPARHDQDRLLTLYSAKIKLEQAINLLAAITTT
ncbi:hypothetical protein HW132_33720 [Brasilonema sp. CT11]|nr:hypothetical protein [Brasilonema sp. CT11]